MRRRVGARLALIWLAVVVPLSVVLLVTYAVWYSVRLSLVEQEREGYARVVADSFQLMLADNRYELAASGADIADQGPESARSGDQMSRIASSFPAAYVAFADEDGEVLGSSDESLVGSSLATDRAFREAMSAPHGQGIEPSEDASGGLVGFHFAQAIPGRNGRGPGVMLMFVDVRRLHGEFAAEVPFGGIGIVDSAGQVVYQDESVRFAESRAQWGDVFPFWRRALEGETAVTRDFRLPTGGRRIAAAVPIEPFGWAAGSSVEPREALAPFYQARAIGLPIAIGMGVVALLISIRTARSIKRSLVELSEDARRIGAGELEEPVRTERPDEIGDVARSLDAARIELSEARIALTYSEQRYRALFDSIDEGYCIIEVIFDETMKPIDYRFLEINHAFERQTGLVDAKGKLMRDLAPDHEEHWFEIYGKVALTGEAIRFENRAEQLHRWYDVYAYRFGDPDKRQVALVFNDITQRRQAEERTRRELARTAVLRDVAAAASELGPEGTGARILEVVGRLLDVSAGVIYRLDETARALDMVSLLGYPAEVRPVFERVPLDESSITGQAMMRGELLVLAFDELPEATRRRAEAAGERATSKWVAVPARSHGRIVGSLTFVLEAARELAEDDLALFAGIGDLLGVALDNAALFEAERERGRLGQSIASINNELTSSLSIDEILPSVLRHACSELGGIGSTVADRVEGGWRIRHIYGIEAPGIERGRVFSEEEAPSLTRVLRTRGPYVVEDVESADDVNRSMAERVGYGAYASYPLMVRSELTGVLTVFFAAPQALSEHERDYLRRVAFAISLSEENSRLYEAEHRIAETLQTALLALPDAIPGVQFAHLYRSATEAARVGGDFYDLFELEHNILGVTVGDIAGHGVDAAVFTSLVKNAIRVRATQQNCRPDEVMATASRLLYDSSPTEVFATVFFGVLHLDDGLLEYCSAGHTTGACVCSGGGVRRLPSNSALMGAFPHQEFGISTDHLEVDDLLFLYTDGLTEARRGGELYGETRLFEVLSRERGGHPEETMRRVFDEALRFAGGRLSDDVAILAVKRGDGEGG